MNLRGESPGKFKSVVRLDHLEWEGVEQSNLREEINTGSWVMVLVDQFAFDARGYVDGSVLIHPAVDLSKPRSSFIP